jgi:hypothetical protein
MGLSGVRQPSCSLSLSPAPVPLPRMAVAKSARLLVFKRVFEGLFYNYCGSRVAAFPGGSA